MDIQLSDEVSQAYLSEVEDILKNKEFLSLSLYEHHQWTNRLMHSINVSYISWKLAKKLGCDATVADFYMIFAPMISGRKRLQENIRHSIIPKLRLTTVQGHLISAKRNGMQF